MEGKDSCTGHLYQLLLASVAPQATEQRKEKSQHFWMEEEKG